MGTSTKILSPSYMGICYGVIQKIARLCMHKVREAMESSQSYPMDGNVHIDEFVLGEREKEKDKDKVGRSYKAKKKKAVKAVELTKEGKVKRIYAMRIEDFSTKSS